MWASCLSLCDQYPQLLPHAGTAGLGWEHWVWSVLCLTTALISCLALSRPTPREKM